MPDFFILCESYKLLTRDDGRLFFLLLKTHKNALADAVMLMIVDYCLLD
jgi:hypothetical protein